MLYQIWMTSALCAVALGAPSFAPGAAARPKEMKVLSEYFQMLATKVQAGKNMAMAPMCDMTKASLPQIPSASNLPAPSDGMILSHVSIGRGTQNYTCSQTNATAAPVAAGAIATLFNTSCVASSYPDVLSILPKVALEFNLISDDQAILFPSNLAVSGHHYFTNLTTPFFNLDVNMKLGVAPCQKNSSVPAPANAPVGQDNKGFGAVPWLKLTTRSGATGDLSEVYRVNTAGGNPPATCAGRPANFEIPYAAEYWFFKSS